MQDRFHKAVYIVCAVFLGFFISLSGIADKTESMDNCTSARQNLPQAQVLLHADNSDISLGYLQFEANSDMTGARLIRGGLKTAVSCGLYLLLIVTFSLLLYKSRSLLAYRQPNLSVLARFLCDLQIQQEKDGKKRTPVL